MPLNPLREQPSMCRCEQPPEVQKGGCPALTGPQPLLQRPPGWLPEVGAIRLASLLPQDVGLDVDLEQRKECLFPLRS